MRCGFRLVLKSKRGREISQSSWFKSSEKIPARRPHKAKKTASPDHFIKEEKESSPLRILLAIFKLLANYLRDNRLLCFISIKMFGSQKNTFLIITSFSELGLRWWFVLLVQTEEVISVHYGNSTGSWKPWRWMNLN